MNILYIYLCACVVCLSLYLILKMELLGQRMCIFGNVVHTTVWPFNMALAFYTFTQYQDNFNRLVDTIYVDAVSVIWSRSCILLYSFFLSYNNNNLWVFKRLLIMFLQQGSLLYPWLPSSLHTPSQNVHITIIQPPLPKNREKRQPALVQRSPKRKSHFPKKKKIDSQCRNSPYPISTVWLWFINY